MEENKSSTKSGTNPTVNGESENDLFPEKVTGDKLRSLSNKFKKSCQGERMEIRSDQNKCHRIPNEILKKAYNSTADQEIKKK